MKAKCYVTDREKLMYAEQNRMISQFRLIMNVLLLFTALAVVPANGQWTRRTSGCYCYFNGNSNDCACCNPGGCQCYEKYRHQCVQCGRGEQCGKLMPNIQWTQSSTGCNCYFDKTSTDCACCYPGGCQCTRTHRNQCVQCNFGEQCGKPFTNAERYIDASTEWQQSRYDNDNTQEVVQKFTYVTGMMHRKSESKTVQATHSAGVVVSGSFFSIISLQVSYSYNHQTTSSTMSEDEVYSSQTIETTVTIPPRSTLIRYHLIADVAGARIGYSHYIDILNDTNRRPENYRIRAKVLLY